MSAQLDELLQLDAHERATRLADRRRTDAAFADELADLLARIDAQDDATFMRVDAAWPSRSIASLAGKTVGAYRLERLLGEGGMGSVWLSRRSDGKYDAQVAIKFLRTGFLGSGSSQRFAREGQILARLDHPNIGRLLDAGWTDGDRQPYLVLEYVDGQPIDVHCDTHRLDLAARLQLFLDVLAAVAHAHERLILHRDLKPSNILVTGGGQVKLLDFGIAKLATDALDRESGDDTPEVDLTLPASRLYTPRYAAPEQVQGADPTTATDVYALGVLLYTLLTGAHPTPPRTDAGPSATSSSLDQMRAVVEVQPRLMSQTVERGSDLAKQDRWTVRRRTRALRGDLDTIVAKALKKRPAERYRSAAEMAEDLQAHLTHEPIAARPDSLGARVARGLRRHWLVAASTATVALGLTVGITVALQQAGEAAVQRAHAEGLIDFMLGDLRGKLLPVGRLDVLDAVSERALAYYNAQDSSRLDAASLGRRASALQSIASLAEQRMHLPEAEATYRKAAAITASLVDRFPRDAHRIAEHSASYSGIASVLQQRGRLEEADAADRTALALAERALSLAPHDIELRIVVSSARSDLGALLVDADRPDAALPILDASLAEGRRLLSERPSPELQRQVINTASIVADANYGIGRYHDAITALSGHWDALTRIPSGEQDRELQNLRSLGLNRMAGSELNLGHVDAALRASEEVVSGNAALAAIDPDNLELLNHLCYERLQFAEILDAAHRPGPAQEQLRLTEAGRVRLLVADPSALALRFAMRGRVLARAASVAPSDPGVTAALQAFLADADRAEAHGEVLDPDAAKNTAAAGLALGDRLQKRQPGDATALYQRALQRLRTDAWMPGPYADYLRAQLHLRLHQPALARDRVDRLEATEYRPPQYVAMRSALEAAERSPAGSSADGR